MKIVVPGVTSCKGVRLIPLDCPRNKFFEAIVLPEAMSYGLSCVVSDIPANREVVLEDSRYFKSGDMDGMAETIRAFLLRPLTDEEKSSQIKQVAGKYNWDTIAAETLKVYEKTIGK